MRENNIRQIRGRLGLSQVAFADAICVSQASVSNYERGCQEVSPDVARRVIAAAHERGAFITFDDVYAPADEETKASARAIPSSTAVIPVVTPERRADDRRDHERRDGERRDGERRGAKGTV